MKIINSVILRYYVCHYGPVGNYIGQQIYQPGRPCSSCPRYTSCSASYSGLCSGNQVAAGNYTKYSSNARPRIETSIKRVPRIRTDSNILVSSSINSRIDQNIPRIISQHRNVAQPRNVPATRNLEKSRIQSNSYRRPRTYSRSQYSPCRNILCRIANFFA